MAPRFDADIIVAGSGPAALLFSRFLAERKVGVLLVPPRDPLPPDRSLVVLTPDTALSVLGEGALPSPLTTTSAALSALGFYKGGKKWGGLISPKEPKNWEIHTLDGLTAHWREGLESLPLVKLEPQLEIKNCEQDASGVTIEGLSPTWSFRYRARYLVHFPEHREAAAFQASGPSGPSRFFLIGDFEDPTTWDQEGRWWSSPWGLVESYPLGRRTRRFILPLKAPVEPYTTEVLRQTLPGLTGADLSQVRQVWEQGVEVPLKEPAPWTLERRWLTVTPLANPGWPGPVPGWKHLKTLAQGLSQAVKAKSRDQEVLLPLMDERPAPRTWDRLYSLGTRGGLLGPLGALAFQSTLTQSLKEDL